MKTLFITISTLITFNFFAQSSIWVSSENISSVQESPEFISTMRVLGDIIITHPFTSSRNEDLLKVYEISCECNETDLYSLMHKVPGLSGIEYSPKYETLSEPNDYASSFTGNWALDLIGAKEAWDYTTGSPSVVLAISDQNFYVNHEELSNKYIYYDESNTATKTHGTAVAAIAAGSTNNSIGMSSIGYNSSLSLRRMNYNDALSASYSGARVINLSWTSGCSYNIYAQAVIDEIYNNGTFIVASAGNGSTCGGANNLVYPAAYNHVFSVTSVGAQDNIEKVIGNPNTRHQTNSSVDICAPGHNVPLTAAPGWYLYSSGTSFAAPYVTGTVGLMVALKPNLTNSQIDSILRISAVNIDSINPSYIGKIGSGRLNSAEALRMVQDMIDQENSQDGNNGHGNDEDGVDSSNPGNGNGNNGNQGGNGNHYGWDKNDKNTLGEISSYEVYDMTGRKTNLDYAPVGYYFIIENGTSKRIYKNY